MLTGFEPILSKEPVTLILGSMPSVTSLQRQEYYGFKHNRFWKIMRIAFSMSIDSYEQKCQIIKQQHLMLWDVIASCEREGSLDSAIHHEIVNDIEKYVNDYPTIQLVICNGRKSYNLYQKHFSHLKVTCTYLPSTSNANRSISEADLIKQWVHKIKR